MCVSIIVKCITNTTLLSLTLAFVSTELMSAMMALEWPPSREYSEDSRYGTLLQISVGQEEQDEEIMRDIGRTFPEYPQFQTAGDEGGQMALFRVLKAYSLHDLEVGGVDFLVPAMIEHKSS